MGKRTSRKLKKKVARRATKKPDAPPVPQPHRVEDGRQTWRVDKLTRDEYRTLGPRLLENATADKLRIRLEHQQYVQQREKWMETTGGSADDFPRTFDGIRKLLKLPRDATSRDVHAALDALRAETEILTEPMFLEDIGAYFDVHRNQVCAKILGRFWHEKVGTRFRMKTRNMPALYHRVLAKRLKDLS